MSQLPRIWDRSGERRVIGETRFSWLVLLDRPQSEDEIAAALAADAKSKPWWWKHGIALVNKIRPNKTPRHPRWFFSEQDRNDAVWADAHFTSIQEAMGRYIRDITVAQLRQIAAVIDYDDETKRIRQAKSDATKQR